MPSTPSWVKDLKVASPHGSEILEKERSQSNVPVQALSEFLFTREWLEKKERLLKVLQAEPIFDKSQNYYSGRVDRYKVAVARAKKLRQISVQKGWSAEEYEIAVNLVGESNPYALHTVMFIPTIRDQGTPEQHKLFLEKAERYEIIGCYAQTELGHGSNVRGLETTATWNPEDKTFTLNSPTLTASKWWIGSLGRTANHAAVMAQLVINGKSYGPHPFIVQIRDLQTHEPLENIHVGDIGPKLGFNTMDNGFLLFNKVKIPHVNMLSRFSRVDPETNKYIKPPSTSLVYGTMTWVRSSIVYESGRALARGVTIATRYCAVRRQFQDRDADKGDGENQVLNYTMVQIRLLPLLAATFALHFTGEVMMRMYQENQKRMAEGGPESSPGTRGPGPEEVHAGSDMLADLHATSCGLKALASTTAGEGLEVCRRACGGHGYSSFSGIGTWYTDYIPTLTWEGDNYMLTQQVARYLLKTARSVLQGKKPTNDTARIFKNFLVKQDVGAAFDVLGNDAELVAAFAWRTSHLTFDVLKQRDLEKKSWNSLLVDFYRLSTAHSQYLVVKSFYDSLTATTTTMALDANTRELMLKLFRLYALYTLEKEASEFFASSAVNPKQIQLARTKHIMKLMEEIRPHAVRLVDVWQFPDWQLESSLGRYDGKVYEDMFHRANELNPLNALVIDPRMDSSVIIRKDETEKFKSKL